MESFKATMDACMTYARITNINITSHGYRTPELIDWSGYCVGAFKGKCGFQPGSSVTIKKKMEMKCLIGF